MPGWTAGLGVGPRQLGFAQVRSSPFFSVSFFLLVFCFWDSNRFWYSVFCRHLNWSFSWVIFRCSAKPYNVLR
jgi:hypothetical protein